jgi:DNA-binding response OmpR family regulator
MSKILVVEDEVAMQIGLRDNLEADGYDVTVAKDGKAGLAAILDEAHDLVILDVMLPHISGYDVLKQARASGARVPVIMLTAKGEEIDRVLGLELGADDYITKPFSLRELLARVKAVLRRAGDAGDARATASVRIGKMEINFSTYKARRGGKEIEMTAKEFDLLHHLWVHRNETVSRDDLLEHVWGVDDSVTTRTIDNFIVRLRQKLEADPAHPRCIVTVHGVGYRLVVDADRRDKL